MAELVASYPVGAFTDPQNGNAPVDADEVRANDDALRSGFNSHDADATIHFQGSVIATRPAAGTAGRKWFASDTRQIFRDNGSSWEEIDYLNLTNGGTVAGATTFTGAVTSTSGSRTFGATTFSGTVTGTAAIFSSTISAAGATLTDALAGTSASFTGNGSFGGTLTASIGTFSVRAIADEVRMAGSSLTLSNNAGTALVTLDGSTGTLTGISATFSGLVSANTGSFSGAVAVGGVLSAQGGHVTVSGNTNPYLALDDGTGIGFLQVVAGDINFTPRSGKAVTVSSDFNIGAGKFVVTGSTGELVTTSTITGGASIVATLNLVAGATAAIDWSGRSQFLSPADGTILMANNAGTSFSRLIFGGTSPSFPALKVSGPQLLVRLGDDSAYADLVANNLITNSLNLSGFAGTAKVIGGSTGVVIRNNADSADNLLISDAGVVTSRSSITSGASIALAATGSLGWLTRSQFLSPSDGKILLTNNAGTDFGLLQFGGTTSSFPAVKRSTTELRVRLADDSDYAPLRSGVLNVINATASPGHINADGNVFAKLGFYSTDAASVGTGPTWLLGGVTAAAVALSTTQYVAVKINGTLVKLAVVT